MGKHLQTVAAMTCMKTLLMIFNFIFWVSGVVIVAIGIYMKAKLYRYLEISTEFSGTAPYVLIGIGSLIILIGSLACCCTVKGQSVLLYVYGAFLAIVFVLELGAGLSLYAYREKLADGFDRGFNDTLANYRTESRDLIADFDVVQSTLHCCGNHKYSDWTDNQLPIPPSCCIKEGCNTEDLSQINKQGCQDKVVDLMSSNMEAIAGAAIGIAFFPLIGVTLSCCLASVINKAKYEQMS